MGYKNDYGGYNVNYYNNINIALHEVQYNGWEVGPVNIDGPGNEIYNNKVIVWYCRDETINCDCTSGVASNNLYGALKMYNNSFYTPHGNATIQTSNNTGKIYLTPKQMQQRYNLSINSTQNYVPSIDQITSWIQSMLDIY